VKKTYLSLSEANSPIIRLRSFPFDGSISRVAACGGLLAPDMSGLVIQGDGVTAGPVDGVDLVAVAQAKAESMEQLLDTLNEREMQLEVGY